MMDEGRSIGEMTEFRVEQCGPAGSEEFTYVDIGSVDRERKCIVAAKVLPSENAPSRAKQVLKTGDVLVSMTRPNLNAVAIVPAALNGAIGSTGFHVLRSQDSHPKFLFYAVQTADFVHAMCQKVQGALYPAVRPEDISSFILPNFSLERQRLVVAKIEELFSELDQGIENLKLARAQLAVYRQALLRHAFEGKLTADWRTIHAVQLESADQLLARIRIEREARFQQQIKGWKVALKKWENKGSKAKRPVKPKQDDPTELLTLQEKARLPRLPSEWTWAMVAELGVVQLGRQRSPKNVSKFHPTKYIRAANITGNGLNLDDVKEMEFLPHELENYRLLEWDLVLSEASGSASQVGKPAVWKSEIPNCCFQNTVIRHRPHLNSTSPYLLTVFKYFYSSGLFARTSGGVGINHLSANKFAVIPVPLAPLEEQAAISEIIDTQLSVIDALEADVDANLLRAEALRQSILKKAFAGELVPQDPNDEPAAARLARIRSERAALAATPKSKKRVPAKA